MGEAGWPVLWRCAHHIRVLAATKGIPLKSDSKELLATFRASLAEHGEVLLVDGMPDTTFTDRWADLGGDGPLGQMGRRSKAPGRPS